MFCNEGNQARLKEKNGEKIVKPIKRTPLKRSTKPLKRSPIKYRRKVTGELVLFQAIWNTRKHVSFLNDKPLGEDAYVWYFAHVLRKAKGHYPKFKLYEKNIILLTKEQHDLYDLNVRNPEYLTGLDARWQKVFDLRDELLLEYDKIVSV